MFIERIALLFVLSVATCLACSKPSFAVEDCYVYKTGESCQSKYGDRGDDEHCATSLQCVEGEEDHICNGWSVALLHDYEAEFTWDVERKHTRLATEEDPLSYPENPGQPVDHLCYASFTCEQGCQFNPVSQQYECVDALENNEEFITTGWSLNTNNACEWEDPE